MNTWVRSSIDCTWLFCRNSRGDSESVVTTQLAPLLGGHLSAGDESTTAASPLPSIEAGKTGHGGECTGRIRVKRANEELEPAVLRLEKQPIPSGQPFLEILQ